MVIGISILLILSTIAILSSSYVFTAQLVYSQGPSTRQQQQQQQQQDLDDLIFQTINVTIDGISFQ